MMQKPSLLIWLLVWILTLVISLVSVTLLFTLGLILIEFLLYPLALGVSALLVSLTAVWTSNQLVRDDLQTPVKAVVVRCEGAAVLLALILIIGYAGDWLPSPPIVVSSIAATILAIIATYSARQLRQPPITDPYQTRRIVIWLIVALAAVPIVIWLASLFGWAGA
jgi:hypothetical protein